MTISYGFYDSLNGDRTYTALEFSSMFDGIVADGIFASVGDGFGVTADTGMDILVGSGRAWFNSTWTANDSAISLTVDAADPTFDRIDTVVIEVDSDPLVRANTVKIVKGTPSATPVAPTLAATATKHQYALADILVGAAVIEITALDITNQVGVTTPLAVGILTTMTIGWAFDQWEAEFQAWFTNLQNQLDTNQVTNLQNQINGLDTRVDDLETDMTQAQADIVTLFAGGGGISDPSLAMASGPDAWLQDFTGLPSALPAGWAFAGTPFGTPDTIDYTAKKLQLRDASGVGIRTFLYREAPTILPAGDAYDLFSRMAQIGYTTGFFTGIRLDDGTDNNYVEWGISNSSTGASVRFFHYYRTAGGAVTSAETNTAWNFAILPAFMLVGMSVRGTAWSNWDARGLLGTDSLMQSSSFKTGNTWTPTRFGITARFYPYVWNSALLRAIAVVTV